MFPIEQAAMIALETIINFLHQHTFGKVVLVLFTDEDFTIYMHYVQQLIKE